MKDDRTIKIIAAVCFILLAVALVLIHNSPATGYEASIYSGTSSIVWACLLISIACGIGIVVHQACHRGESKNLWALGLALILLSNAIILSLHILRGYGLWCMIGDPGSHLGKIIDVIAAGHIERSNSYPIAHIYLAQLTLVSGLDPDLWHKWTPVLTALLQMVFLYFLAKSVLPDKRQVMLAAVAGTALVYGWYLNLTPNHLSNMLFPLALYLLVRSFTTPTPSWKILFVIMVFLFPPFHSIPGVVRLIVVATVWVAERVLRPRAREAIAATPVFRINIPLVMFGAVWVVTWISSFYIWELVIRNLHTLATEGAPMPIQSLLADIGPGTEHTYSVARQFFIHYTSIIIYLVLALAAFPILLRLRRAGNGNQARLLALYGPLAVIAALFIAGYFLPLTYGPGRVLTYVMMICAVFAGFTLFELIKRTASHNNWRARVGPVIAIVLLLGVSLHGISIVYTSKLVLSANWQATYSEIEGMENLFEHKETEVPISGFTVEPLRYETLLVRAGEGRRGKEIRGEHHLLFHFGYDEYPRIGQSYEVDEYRVIATADRIFCVEVKPELAEEWFLPEDFARLEDDPSIDKLYANGGFDYWYVHAEASSSS